MKEVAKEQAIELFANIMGLLTQTEEEATIAASKIVAAREKGSTDKTIKKYMSKLDHAYDNIKDQITDILMDLFDEEIVEASQEKEKFDMASDLLDEGVDIILDYCKKLYISNATMAVDSVLHPERVKEDYKEAHNIGLEFNVAVYALVEKVINAAVKFASEEKEIKEEEQQDINFVLESCEDTITNLRSQITGKKKVNPIVRNVEDVKKIAEETEKAMEPIKKQEKLEVSPAFQEVESIFSSRQEEDGSFLEVSALFHA